MADDNSLRKSILNGKKSERVIFAVTPEMKRALVKLAEENCVSMSAYITNVLAQNIVENEEVVKP